MIGDAIAGWIGSSIDKRDGEGGTMGALVGVGTWEVAKRVVPAVLLLGGAVIGGRLLTRKLRDATAP